MVLVPVVLMGVLLVVQLVVLAAQVAVGQGQEQVAVGQELVVVEQEHQDLAIVEMLDQNIIHSMLRWNLVPRAILQALQ